MAGVGQGLSVAGGPGPATAAEGASPSPTLKGATKAASKGGGKTAGAAEAAAKSDKPSGSQQRHSIQKTMSK